MARATNLDKRFMEAIKRRRFELRIVEPEEVVHDDVTGESWVSIGEVQRFFAGLEFLHAQGEGVDVAVDDVNEVEDGAAGEPGMLVFVLIGIEVIFEMRERRLAMCTPDHGIENVTTHMGDSAARRCLWNLASTVVSTPPLVPNLVSHPSLSRWRFFP
jgi:hypothetical protein